MTPCIYIYIGIVHIVHEACSYSVASSVMEHVLAVHSVIWYRPHGVEHSLHLHSSLGSWTNVSASEFEGVTITLTKDKLNSYFIERIIYAL